MFKKRFLKKVKTIDVAPEYFKIYIHGKTNHNKLTTNFLAR